MRRNNWAFSDSEPDPAQGLPQVGNEPQEQVSRLQGACDPPRCAFVLLRKALSGLVFSFSACSVSKPRHNPTAAVARDERIERIVNIYAGLVADVGLNIYCSQLPPRNEGESNSAAGSHLVRQPAPVRVI